MNLIQQIIAPFKEGQPEAETVTTVTPNVMLPAVGDPDPESYVFNATGLGLPASSDASLGSDEGEHV